MEMITPQSDNLGPQIAIFKGFFCWFSNKNRSHNHKALTSGENYWKNHVTVRMVREVRNKSKVDNLRKK